MAEPPRPEPTESPAGGIQGLVARLEWLTQVGARTARTLAVVAWLGALGSWITVFRTWGGLGWAALVIAILPGAVLWSYAGAIDAAVDLPRLKTGVRDVLDRTGSHIGEVAGAIGAARFRLVRTAIASVRTVRRVREDIDDLGVDFVNWAKVSNPLFLAAVAWSIAAAFALVALAAVAGLLRLIF